MVEAQSNKNPNPIFCFFFGWFWAPTQSEVTYILVFLYFIKISHAYGLVGEKVKAAYSCLFSIGK
jgi:hypothetical protein